MKARICPNVNLDKDGIRKDSAVAQFLAIRLMLSLFALMGLKVAPFKHPQLLLSLV